MQRKLTIDHGARAWCMSQNGPVMISYSSADEMYIYVLHLERPAIRYINLNDLQRHR